MPNELPQCWVENGTLSYITRDSESSSVAETLKIGTEGFSTFCCQIYSDLTANITAITTVLKASEDGIEAGDKLRKDVKALQALSKAFEATQCPVMSACCAKYAQVCEQLASGSVVNYRTGAIPEIYRAARAAVKLIEEGKSLSDLGLGDNLADLKAGSLLDADFDLAIVFPNRRSPQRESDLVESRLANLFRAIFLAIALGEEKAASALVDRAYAWKVKHTKQADSSDSAPRAES